MSNMGRQIRVHVNAYIKSVSFSDDEINFELIDEDGQNLEIFGF